MARWPRFLVQTDPESNRNGRCVLEKQKEVEVAKKRRITISQVDYRAVLERFRPHFREALRTRAAYRAEFQTYLKARRKADSLYQEYVQARFEADSILERAWSEAESEYHAAFRKMHAVLKDSPLAAAFECPWQNFGEYWFAYVKTTQSFLNALRGANGTFEEGDQPFKGDIDVESDPIRIPLPPRRSAVDQDTVKERRFRQWGGAIDHIAGSRLTMQHDDEPVPAPARRSRHARRFRFRFDRSR
jgi:hypothetical protein